ncbi:multiple sugar transport system substrate-binding protein [Geomicrobium halophilum]|uniref:Multiple sugar transport system substrate-binding protein n=1 Tax=Geomicrobium halophilum TaxID=549000 RepID=A0A841PXN9_9BACL|nr:extracellular solute-binding protein [Geomicrobium halophilum]MBB6448775.1 multiple sugar transport system substrate-binding protein [Geomicrobium halophilum]
MKRLFVGTCYALSLSLVLAACGSGDDLSEETGAEGEEAPDSISVAMVAGQESAAMRPIIAEFEEETGIEIEWNEFDYDTLYERIFNDLQSGSGTYDVIFADDPWMPMFAGGGYLTPLDEFDYEIDEDFMESSRALTTWPPSEGPRMPDIDPEEEPRHYGIPQVGNVQLLFWRKDILGDEAPETWEDAAAMLEEHEDETDYGFVPRGARGNAVATNFNAFMWSHNGDFFDDDWNVTVNDSEVHEALNRYTELAETGPSGVANYGADEVGRAMSQGDTLMAIVWPVWAETMENEEESEVVGDIGYGLVPRSEDGEHAPQIGNWVFAIPEASENRRAAFDFIEWASSEEIQLQMAQNGGLPTRESVLLNEELNEEMPYLEAVHEGLENAEIRPRTPSYSEVEETIGTYLNQVVAGEMSEEDALENAASDIEDIMESAGHYDTE